MVQRPTLRARIVDLRERGIVDPAPDLALSAGRVALLTARVGEDADRDGRRSPVVSFMKVDLPQPEGPTMAMNSPLLTRRSIASTAKLFWASSVSL